MNPSLQFKTSPYTAFMQETQVTLDNGLQLQVEVGGDPSNPKILLIMGLGAQLLFWPDAFCKALIDKGFYVVRFDNRDIGLSTKIRHKGKHVNTLKLMGRFALGLTNQGAPYTLYDMTEDVAMLIDAMQLGQVNVIGASMGGMIAQILAAQYPDKVKNLGLLFTSNNRALLPPPFPKQLFSLIGKPKTRDEQGIVDHTVKLFQTIGSPGYIDNAHSVQLAKKLYQRNYNPSGVLQQFLAILCTGSLLKLDHLIKQPTLVVHGSKDRLLPPYHGRAVARAIPQAKFELISGMGHDIPEHFIPQLSVLFTHHFKS